MRIKDSNHSLRDIADAAVKHNGQLRQVDAIYAKVGGALRVVWRRIKEAVTGWVFTQGRPISVSGRMIRLNGQK